MEGADAGAGAGSFFAAANSQVLEASFKEFAARPENRAAVLAAQSEELRRSLKLRERAQLLQLQEQLQAAPADVQRNLAPLLRHPALRSIIQTFLADPSTGGGPPDAMSQGQGQATASSAAGSIAVWGRNPQVLALLQAAARMVEGGQLQEGALQEALLWQLKGQGSSGAGAEGAPGGLTVCLAGEQLVEALNEHVMERRAAAAAYRQRDFPAAANHYERALAVVRVVRAQSAEDQEEVGSCLEAALLGLAAARLGLREYAAAAAACSEMLERSKGNVTALLRRARALKGLHELQGARADAEQALAMQGSCGEAECLLADLAAAERQEMAHSRELCRKMFQNL